MNYTKLLASALCGMFGAVLRSAVPMFVLTAAFVAVDVASAIRLQLRLAKAGKLEKGKVRISSLRFARVLFTLAKIFVLLILTAMADHLVLAPLGIPALKIVAGAVCFWQALSILENEAAENNAPWAVHARRFLVDKALRYIDSHIQRHNR